MQNRRELHKGRKESRGGEQIKKQPEKWLSELRSKGGNGNKEKMSETHKAWREIEEDEAALRNSRAIQHEQKKKQNFLSKARLPLRPAVLLPAPNQHGCA